MDEVTIDFRTQIEVAGYAVTGGMPDTGFAVRLVEGHEAFGDEAFWDANRLFLERIEQQRDGAVVQTPARYALLPAMIAAARKHGDDWLA